MGRRGWGFGAGRAGRAWGVVVRAERGGGRKSERSEGRETPERSEGRLFYLAGTCFGSVFVVSLLWLLPYPVCHLNFPLFGSCVCASPCSTFSPCVPAFPYRLPRPPSLPAFPYHLPLPPSLPAFPCHLPLPTSLATFPYHLPLPPSLPTLPFAFPPNLSVRLPFVFLRPVLPTPSFQPSWPS